MENFIFLCSLKDRDKRSAQSDIYDVACFAKTLNHTCLATSKIRLCIAIMRAVKLIIEILFTGMITYNLYSNLEVYSTAQKMKFFIKDLFSK